MRSLVLVVLLLTGCTEVHHSENQDPRKGRVYVWEDCFSEGCYTNWKVCVGPDLLIRIDDDTKRGIRRWERDSEECKP